MSRAIDLLPELRAHVARKYGKQIRAAEAWGVSNSFVSAVLNGDKAPPEWILHDAGIERVVTYRRARRATQRQKETQA